MAALFPSLVNSLKDGANNLKTLSNELKAEFKDEADKIKSCSEVYKAGKNVVSSVTSDMSGGMSADSLSKLITNFDGNWDKFAAAFDKAFNADTSEGHTNMLEKFAKEHFGEGAFKFGSCIKNNSSDYLDLYDATKTLAVSGIADFKSGDYTKLFTDFDKNWDKWASAVNTVFNRGSNQSQVNILETFAIDHFGANVFNTGSVIKNETPDILNAIGTFKSGIASFGGSYRNPVEAINKIKNGVDKIVKSTEQMAKSLNKIVQLFQSKGTMKDAPGLAALDALGNLSSNKAVEGVQNILKGAADAANNVAQGGVLAADVGGLTGALKQGDIKGTIAAGKKVADDVKAVFKDGSLAKNGSATSQTSNAASKAETPQSKETPQESQDDSSFGGNVDSYVCSGATMKCSFGSASARLTVYPDRTVYLTDQPMANITDHISLYNIAAFGRCRTTAFPPTGAATAAAHGKLTPMPCVPGTQSNWMNGKNDVLVKGDAALLKSSYCRCCWGGIITITKDGQK